MVIDRRLHPILAATCLAATLALAPLPAWAAQVFPVPSSPKIEKQGDPELPPAPAICPAREVDRAGELVERCAIGDEQADFAVRVHKTPFDTARADWLVQHESLDLAQSEDLVALFGSATATVKHAIGQIMREATAQESWLEGGVDAIEATVKRRPTVFIAIVVILFVLIFGGAVAWVLVRRARRQRRRANAGRRTAAALMGELVSIRDGLRDLQLDNRPGRLEDLERVAGQTAAYAKHQSGLRLIDRAASTLIIGFYRELRALPEPYIEERAGKLGTHRILRLEAADEFAAQTESLAGRANELAAVLRSWLDQNLERR